MQLQQELACAVRSSDAVVQLGAACGDLAGLQLFPPFLGHLQGGQKTCLSRACGQGRLLLNAQATAGHVNSAEPGHEESAACMQAKGFRIGVPAQSISGV